SFELKDKNIHILTACPGQIATDFRKNASKGHPQKSSTLALTPLRAARILLRQITKDKPLTIFPLTTRIALFLLKFAPNKKTILQKTLKSRFLDN
ncbi:MAG: hypothetical protein P0S94_05430, partial [Simkaniaceae bacterium]|nr:hypothetical protein [Simkaniaceae bacterium]